MYDQVSYGSAVFTNVGLPWSTLSEVGGWVRTKALIQRYAWQHEYGRVPLYNYKCNVKGIYSNCLEYPQVSQKHTYAMASV